MNAKLGPLPNPAAEVCGPNICADHSGPVEACQYLPTDTILFTADQMEAERQRCYALGVAAERERCAKLCDAIHDLRANSGFPREASTAKHLASMIRNQLP